jgi:hypothetical protein
LVKIKYRIIFCLVLAFVLCVPSSSNAMDNRDLDGSSYVPVWTLIKYADNNFYINPDGRASMTASISAYSGIDRVSMTSHLQRYVNNTWVTIKHWTHENSGTSAFWSEDYYVSTGYSYRLVTYFFAYKGTSADSASLISKTQYY